MSMLSKFFLEPYCYKRQTSPIRGKKLPDSLTSEKFCTARFTVYALASSCSTAATSRVLLLMPLLPHWKRLFREFRWLKHRILWPFQYISLCIVLLMYKDFFANMGSLLLTGGIKSEDTGEFSGLIKICQNTILNYLLLYMTSIK